MQPPAFRSHESPIEEIWDILVRRGRFDDPVREQLDPAILRSWRRCSPRLDPLTRPHPNRLHDDAFRNVLATRFDILAIARPFMEDIHQFVEGSGHVVLLTDGAACILETFGDKEICASLEEVGLQRGVYWNEGNVGTNGIALALQEAMPIQVTGSEHYVKLYHDFCCSAAPVHDVSGRIRGALAMIGRQNRSHSHTLSTVMAAARAIENQLQTDLYLQEANRRLTELRSVFSAISEGVMSWTNDGKITHINEQAGQIMGVQPRSVLGRHVDEVFALPASIADAAHAGKTLHDIEASIGVDTRTVDCLISVRPILEGARGPVGSLMTLRPIERVHQLVHRLVGAEATLTLENVLGDSDDIREARRRARLAARGRAPVLLHGEDGVGKNPLARAIHNESERAHGPFISINCLAVPHELMVSEFLGHEGGPLNETHSDGRPSKFELADKGTLFLDEVEHLSLEMQAALLQVIDTGHVMRLGSTRAIPVDVRIIAASSSNLEAEVEDGNLRSDLYYRFGVFMIEVPPLRDRVEDIPVLVKRFLDRSRHAGRHRKISDEALEILMQYPWPGNIRELENVLERALVHADSDCLTPKNLPNTIRSRRALTPDSPKPQPVLSFAEAERQAIIRAGYAYNGKIMKMAEKLGIGRTTLWRKMKQFDLDPDRFKPVTE